MKNILALIATALLTACGGAAPATPSLVTMASALRCDTILQPGSDSDGRVEAIAPGPEGRLAWTRDFEAKQLVLRDATGGIREVGRAGSGPGEFEWAASFGWHGDTLWASDLSVPRVQYFSASGEYLRGVPLPIPESWVAAPTGEFLSLAGKGIGAAGWNVIRAGAEGTRLDTLYHFPGASAERVNIPIPGGALMATQPFDPDPRAGSSADGAWWCGTEPLEGDQVRLRCIDASGVLHRDTTLVLEGRPVTDSLYEGQIAGYLKRPGVRREDVVAAIRKPAFMPRVMGLLVDPSGAVWLRRSQGSEPAVRWMRLRADGTLRDTLLLDSHFAPRRLLRDTLWVTSENDDGLVTVSRCVARG